MSDILDELKIILECELCGYKKNRAALCFHHVDDSEKDFSFSGTKIFPRNKLKEELMKCVVLCHNCHMETHYPELGL